MRMCVDKSLKWVGVNIWQEKSDTLCKDLKDSN